MLLLGRVVKLIERREFGKRLKSSLANVVFYKFIEPGAFEKIAGFMESGMSQTFENMGMEQEKIDGLLGTLPPISKRKITDLLLESNPNAGEKATCISKILTEVRGFISQGILKLEKVDPDLIIPENIEELLSVTSLDTLAISADSPLFKADDKPNIVGEAVEPQTAGPADVDFLRRKLNHLSAEVNALKHENSVLKDRLAQIKKIA